MRGTGYMPLEENISMTPILDQLQMLLLLLLQQGLRTKFIQDKYTLRKFLSTDTFKGLELND